MILKSYLKRPEVIRYMKTKISTTPTPRMLTLQQLKDMKEGIFAQGETVDSPEGANMANTGKTIKWVAVRGHINDWAIYTDNPYMPRSDFEGVARMGDKIHDRETVKKLVPCDDEALKMYRD